MSRESKGSIEALLYEERRYPPSPEFREKANWNSEDVYQHAEADPEAFWAEMAQQIDWFEPWTQVLEWQLPKARWFCGGQLNISYNCVDRHLTTWRKNRAAIIWEGEPGDSRIITYQELYREVNRCAAVLRKLGISKGDRIALYMGMVPELAISMLACARIGAPHTIVFGGFSPESLKDRINDCQARLLITADGAWRRGSVVPLKENADAALKGCPSIEHVLVVNRTAQNLDEVPFQTGRDHWWHEETDSVGQARVEPEALDSEHPLYILYTSGTTGKPKGLLHTTGGYLVGAHTTCRYVFDLKDDDTYWCAADIGWVTGHSYIVYGPLSNGTTSVMYEGAPDCPDKARFWSIIERYQVNILYTAPTAIRAFMGWGNEYPARHDLSSLRLLGSVGEPINPEAWVWYREHIGGDKTPIVDTWWQTETGMILITPLPGITTTKPGSATRAFPGIEADIVDEEGTSVPVGGGYLVLKRPWPGMARTIWGDDERFRETYWSQYPNLYFTGDGAKRDEDGFFWLLGRVDDVLNVAGHRIGTMEVESALVSHPDVAEAAVIGVSDAIKGQAIAAFVTLRSGAVSSGDVEQILRNHVAEVIGPIAKPKSIYLTADLPKTRSGKIMRRLLRDVAEGRVLSDTTTLADPAVVEQIRSKYQD